MAEGAEPEGGSPKVMMRVIVLCPGLDHVRRGFETWSRECFEALGQQPDVGVTLCKGSGRTAPNELVARTVRRDRTVARIGARASRTSGYFIEQKVFAQRVKPTIRARSGCVVLLNDWHLSRELSSWRRRSGASFGLVLCNGGADSPPFDHLDRVLQPRPGLLHEALAAGEPAGRHTLLPLAAHLTEAPPINSPGDVHAIRRRLDLPVDRPVLLSVAALNRQKRLDYVIAELAAMPSPRPFLMLAGQTNGETGAIRSLAESALGSNGYAMRTVPSDQVSAYYRTADAFVLASLHEGSPRVLVEALAHGLTCIAHDWDAPRFVLGEHGLLGDLRPAGGLRALLPAALTDGFDSARRAERHRSAYDRFSWDRQVARYLDVLRECVPRSAVRAAAA
jgi:glycosyltransferase involved in cell wall biosynthesis